MLNHLSVVTFVYSAVVLVSLISFNWIVVETAQLNSRELAMILVSGRVCSNMVLGQRRETPQTKSCVQDYFRTAYCKFLAMNITYSLTTFSEFFQCYRDVNVSFDYCEVLILSFKYESIIAWTRSIYCLIAQSCKFTLNHHYYQIIDNDIQYNVYIVKI